MIETVTLAGAIPFEGDRPSHEALPVAVHDRLDPLALARESTCDGGEDIPAVHLN